MHHCTFEEVRPINAVTGRGSLLCMVQGAPAQGTSAWITVPVQFIVQWDDQTVPRDQCLALFDALASAEKTLHANPGKHGDVPSFEVDSSLRFFARHLS